MRVASWAFVLCAVLVAVGVFVPCLELRLGRKAISKHTDRSLYEASSDRQLMRRMLAAYHSSGERKTAAKIVRAVTPRIGGRPRAALEDARDAMDTLDEVTDRDVKTAGTALTITVWGVVGLATVMVLLVFGDLMRGSYRRWRLVLALITAAATTGVAIAVHIVCREAAWQANDEVGREIVALAPAAYLLPGAALAALVTAVVLVARRPATAPLRSRAR